MRTVLLTSAFLLLLMASVLAEDSLPASNQTRLATAAYLETLMRPEFTKVMLKAQSGERESEYLLALICAEGRLVPKDFVAARGWMLKSAEQGYVPAQAGLGEMYSRDIGHNGAVPGYADAERWLRLAATQGNADAQLWLGYGYERGYFGTFDYREALKWLRKAAAQGLPDAQFGLGQMYEDGEGVPESASVAASWYRKAANHFPENVAGVWESEGQLARMYREGRLPKDYVEAYMWFAILGSAVTPPAVDDMKWAARHMTTEQIAKAQRMAEDWIKRHRHQGPTSDDNSLDPTQVAK